MRYEREGYYSLPFTLVYNKVSQVINWRLDKVEISGINKTDTGHYVYADDGYWLEAGTGYRGCSIGNVRGEVGCLVCRGDNEFRARVYDPFRDARINRVQVRISADKYFEVANEVFQELDVLERELFLGPQIFRRI
ncbi:MAG: hypothetical protein V1836_03610 [Candidatus Aenigmatarchaeota archaeon]